MTTLYYDLDAADRIVAVSPEWDEFARANDGEAICSERVIGTLLWDHVHDAETRQFLRELLRAVRGHDRELTLPMACHSPETARGLLFHAAAVENGRVRISTATVNEHVWQPVLRLLAASAERSDELVRVCSWCNRGFLDGSWMELDELGSRLGLLLRERMPRLTHGICSDCAGRIEALAS